MYFTITIAANSEYAYEECKKSPCVVPDLQPYSSYSLQMSVVNGAGEGPKSTPPFEFEMPEGRK